MSLTSRTHSTMSAFKPILENLGNLDPNILDRLIGPERFVNKI